MLPAPERPWETGSAFAFQQQSVAASRKATVWPPGSPHRRGARLPSRKVRSRVISAGGSAKAAVAKHLGDTTHSISQDRQE